MKAAGPTGVATLVQELETNGIVRLPAFVSDEVLRDMQDASQAACAPWLGTTLTR